MKLKIFDVVELKNNNRATILEVNENKYFAEIVNNKGETVEIRNINQNDIKRIVFTK